MTKQDILEYLGESPSNTNPAVISGMLEAYAKSDNKEEIELSATETKVYTPASGKVYKKVTVNVEQTTYAIYIDMNGGELAGSDFALSSGIAGTDFVVDDWYQSVESSITPPTETTWNGLSTEKDSVEAKIDEITLNNNVILYALWETAK